MNFHISIAFTVQVKEAKDRIFRFSLIHVLTHQNSQSTSAEPKMMKFAILGCKNKRKNGKIETFLSPGTMVK